MASAEAALDVLRANLGLGESPSNHNWITVWAGLGDVAWCAETVSRALDEAFGNPDRWQVPGVRPDYSWGFAYVPNLRAAFIAAGRYHDTPEVGDVVIYSWGPGSPIGDHTGLVEQVPGDGTIVALEGNDSANQIGRHRRTIAAVCDGFGRPAYDALPPPPPPERGLAMLTFRYVSGGLDWVFDGPSRLFFHLDNTDQITQVLDPLGVKALGPVSDATHKRYSDLASAAHFSG